MISTELVAARRARRRADRASTACTTARASAGSRAARDPRGHRSRVPRAARIRASSTHSAAAAPVPRAALGRSLRPSRQRTARRPGVPAARRAPARARARGGRCAPPRRCGSPDSARRAGPVLRRGRAQHGASWHAFLVGAFEPGRRAWRSTSRRSTCGCRSRARSCSASRRPRCTCPAAIGGDAGRRRRSTTSAPPVRPRGRRSPARAALAVLPVAVITARSDTMDSVMARCVRRGAALTARAARSGAPPLLVAAGAVLGLAFEVKLFEALVAAPALSVLWWFGRPRPAPAARGRAGRRAARRSSPSRSPGWWPSRSCRPATGRARSARATGRRGTRRSSTTASTACARRRPRGPPRRPPPRSPGPRRRRGPLGCCRPARRSGAASGSRPRRRWRSWCSRWRAGRRAAWTGPAAPASPRSRSGSRRPRARERDARRPPALPRGLHPGGGGGARRRRGARRPRPGPVAGRGRFRRCPVASLAVSVGAVAGHRTDSGRPGLSSPPPGSRRSARSCATPTTGARPTRSRASAPSKAAQLIARDGRPVLVLASVDGRPLVTPRGLAAAVAAGHVRYVLLGDRCVRAPSAACTPVARWARAHGDDVSAAAGQPVPGFVYRLSVRPRHRRTPTTGRARTSARSRAAAPRPRPRSSAARGRGRRARRPPRQAQHRA